MEYQICSSWTRCEDKRWNDSSNEIGLFLDHGHISRLYTNYSMEETQQETHSVFDSTASWCMFFFVKEIVNLIIGFWISATMDKVITQTWVYIWHDILQNPLPVTSRSSHISIYEPVTCCIHVRIRTLSADTRFIHFSMNIHPRTKNLGNPADIRKEKMLIIQFQYNIFLFWWSRFDIASEW